MSKTASTTNQDELVDWKPVAARLNLKERALWDLVHQHGLPYYRINARVFRFKMSEVEAWLESRRVGVPL